MSNDGTLSGRVRQIADDLSDGTTHCEACWQWHDACALHRLLAEHDALAARLNRTTTVSIKLSAGRHNITALAGPIHIDGVLAGDDVLAASPGTDRDNA